MAKEENEKTQETQKTESHHHHTHHHHDHHHSKKSSGKHVDGSERFKRHNLSAAKRRKLMEKWTFILLSILAVAITLFCIYLYNIEN